MKIVTNKQIDLLKLTKALMVTAFAGLALNANAQCVADYSFSVSPANDGLVTFTNNSTGSLTPLYQWNFGDGGYVFGTSATHTYATGTYNACLIMTDSSSSCSDSVCHSITVTNNSATSCNASFSVLDSALYILFLNQSTGTALTGTWDFGDGNVGTSTGNTGHTYAAAGTYYVCLTVSNALGCSDTHCDTVEVGNGPCMGGVNTYFTFNDSLGYGVFTNSPTSSTQTYFWNFGDGAHSTDVGNTSHLYSANGMYNVCLTVYDTVTGDSCQNCSYVTIGSILSCNASYSIHQDSLDNYHYDVHTYWAGSPAATYFWDFGDGTSSTLQYPSHTYAGTGPYYLCLTVTDGSPLLGSCTNTYCDSLAAGRSETGITVTVVAALPTGIAEQSTTTLLENYPNPFSGSTTINYAIATDAAVELTVVDLLGNNVATLEKSHKAAGSYTAVWNADNVAQGMYLLQMKANNSVTIKKIVVNK